MRPDDPLSILEAEYERWDRAPGNNRPVALVLRPQDAKRILDRRECSHRSICRGDEDGPLEPPVELICRLFEGHTGMHTNGAITWT